MLRQGLSCPDCPWTWDPPASASLVARITRVGYQTPLSPRVVPLAYPWVSVFSFQLLAALPWVSGIDDGFFCPSSLTPEDLSWKPPLFFHSQPCLIAPSSSHSCRSLANWWNPARSQPVPLHPRSELTVYSRYHTQPNINHLWASQPPGLLLSVYWGGNCGSRRLTTPKWWGWTQTRCVCSKANLGKSALPLASLSSHQWERLGGQTRLSSPACTPEDHQSVPKSLTNIPQLFQVKANSSRVSFIPYFILVYHLQSIHIALVTLPYMCI